MYRKTNILAIFIMWGKTTRKSNFDRNLTSLDRVDHCYGLKMRGINYIIPLSVHTSVFMEMLWYTKTEGKIWRSYRQLTIVQLYKLNLPNATVLISIFKTRLLLKDIAFWNAVVFHHWSVILGFLPYSLRIYLQGI